VGKRGGELDKDQNANMAGRKAASEEAGLKATVVSQSRGTRRSEGNRKKLENGIERE